MGHKRDKIIQLTDQVHDLDELPGIVVRLREENRRLQKRVIELESERTYVWSSLTCQACGDDDASQHLCLTCLESGER